MVPPPPKDSEELSWRQRPRQQQPGTAATGSTTAGAASMPSSSTSKATSKAALGTSSIAMASHNNAGKPFQHIFAPPTSVSSHAASGPKPSSPRRLISKATDSDNWRSHDHPHQHHAASHTSFSSPKAHFAALAPSTASSSASSSSTIVPPLSSSHGHRQAPGDAFKFGSFAAHRASAAQPSNDAGGGSAAPRHIVSGSLPKSRPPRETSAEPDAGPAAPLRPLQLAAASRGLAHPNQPPLLGGENWALTPSDSLPSLPGTPRKPTSSSSEVPGGWSAELSGLGARGLVVTRGFRSTPSPTLAAGAAASQQLAGGSATMSSLARSLVASGSPKRSSLVLPGSAASGSDSNSGSPHLGHAVPSGAASAASSSGSGPVASRPPSLLLRPSPGPSPRLGHRTATPLTSSHLASMEEEGTDGGSAKSSNASRSILSPTHGLPPSLLRKESSASMTSSAGGSGPPSAALLSASRRASVVYASAASPSPSVTGSTTAAAHAAATAAEYGIYRPPHLRNRGSTHNLQPLVAHYDRVRDPSIRGQSRSPDPSIAASSRAGSRAPSVAPFSPGESLLDGRPGGGRRRLSSLGSFHSSLAASEFGDAARAESSLNGWASASVVGDDAGSVVNSGGTGSGGGSSVFFTSPAEGAHDHFGGGSAGGNLFSGGGNLPGSGTPGLRHKQSVDDFDLEDMMAASQARSITDSYCMSRQGSGTTSAEPVDIFQIGERIGPGLMHDGYRISIAPTSAGFLDQPDDVTGSQLEIVRKLGEGSYAVVYLVREVDPLPEQGDRDALFGDADDLNTGTPSAAQAMGGAAGSKASTLAAKAAEEETEDLYSRTLRPEDDVAGTILSRRQSTSAMDAAVSQSERKTPREFALKCLCKRDLSDEMLVVQRLESTIHQSIPPHPNIVTLYRTYETAEWLFLVLEYCPGQDLYYWLERAQDSEGVSSPPTGTIDGSADVTISGDTTAGMLGGVDSTPPSPSLLASTAGNTLLSRKRLRLVSRMFKQMCDSVQFCHDRGISHRDIKPENFIVEDRRLEVMGLEGSFSQPSIEEQLQSAAAASSAGGTPSRAPMNRSVSVISSASALGDSTRSDGRVIVKLTDFGLAVAQDRCIDFDCGSKPYMAYECRNNIVEWYDPKQADIWSLGVVLLNLIFHRSPFSEPSTEACDSFAAYVYDPVSFLMQAFEGLTESMATFFATRVFCDVTNTNPDGSPRKRISAAEFGVWAMDLVEHLGLEKGAEAKVVSRGADEGITSPMVHSRSPSRSALASLMGSPAILHRLSLRDGEVDDLDDVENYPSLFPEYNTGLSTPSTATAIAPVAPIVAERSMDAVREEESPPPRSTDTSLPDTETAEAEAGDGQESVREGVNGEERKAHAEPPQPAAEGPSSDQQAQPSETSGGEGESHDTVNGAPLANGSSAHGEDDEGSVAPNDGSEADADSVRPPLSTVSSNPKRRKRGQRKGRTALKQELKRSRSHENFKMTISAPRDGSASPALSHPRDAVLAELAEASQTLAREMSKAMKAQGGLHGPHSLPTTPLLPAFKRPTHPGISVASGTGESGGFGQADDHAQVSDGASILGSASSRASTPFTNLSLVDRERLSMAIATADELEPPTPTSPYPGGGPSGSSSTSKWGSAAHRRERMIAERAQRSQETSGSSLPGVGASGKTWRDRNQSNASVDSISSLGSFMTDATSSIYSTASAPAALAIRRSLEASSRRSRPTYGKQPGLESISERHRDRREKQLDPSYLAAIFGGKAKPPQRRDKEKERHKEQAPPLPPNPTVVAAKGETRAPASPRVEAALAAVAAAKAQAHVQRSDEALSHRSEASTYGEVQTGNPQAHVSIGMRKDASTSTSSLVESGSAAPTTLHSGTSSASLGQTSIGSITNGSVHSSSAVEGAPTGAPRKKAGLSKFLTSVRSYNARSSSGRSEQ